MILQTTYTRTIETFSAIKVTDSQCSNFPSEKYSKFKFGSTEIAREFGYKLADSFLSHKFKCSYDGKPIVVLPSAYSHIPTASYYLTMHFVDKLNQFLFEGNFPPVETGKIHRSVTYREDYGEMSAEDRFNLIKGDKFHVDKTNFKNKILIFLDDIKITGTHERIIVKMLDDFDIQNHCYMLYYAELSNYNISPSIENYLNHYFVKDVSDLSSIVIQDDFMFNTRIVKFILNSNHESCKEFVECQNISFLQQLFFLAIGNEYYKFPEYLPNLTMIKSKISIK